jgi:hypothetical protein
MRQIRKMRDTHIYIHASHLLITPPRVEKEKRKREKPVLRIDLVYQ